MIRAVLFDLDGTLLNRDLSVRKFIHDQYERLLNVLVHIPKEEYVQRFIELDYRGYVWKDKVYRQLVKEYAINEITWEELLEDYLANFRHSCVPFPNLIQILENLKGSGMSLGMITNGKGQFQLDNIRALGIAPYIDAILISEWEGIKKPNEQIFQRALNKLSVRPEESIFVGDHPEKDIAAARNVGMRTVWKKDLHWEGSNADYIIEDLIELSNILEMEEAETNER
ncbi:HAD family hydrolase [Virgibacillus kekensis]|uniref:HAD family hydrolase n=1 Tax=Virgibacillus kekensis TaxID=202261 RepID=A0ABV9DME9_9BACI